MNRLLPFLLALFVAAGCGQDQQPADSVETATADNAAAESAPAESAPAESAPAEAPAPAPAAAPAEAAAAGAAGSAPDERIEVAQADLDAVEAAGFVEGQHYFRLSPAQPTSTGPDQVEVAEFFMYSCIHCYNLEPYVEAWLEDKPDFINFVRVPTTWDDYRRLLAQAYYTAESLDIVDEINLPLFREIHDAGNYLETEAKMADFFARFDVSRDEFDSRFNSFAIMTQVNRADELGRRYRVDATPTIVINGKYRTGVDRAGSAERLFELIEVLSAAELGR